MCHPYFDVFTKGEGDPKYIEKQYAELNIAV